MENEVPDVVLPDVLEGVDSPDEWFARRRPEILELFEEHVYGRIPAIKELPPGKVIGTKDGVAGGRATRKEIEIPLVPDQEGPKLHVLLYIPVDGTPAPGFVGLNFAGNHTIEEDPSITIYEDVWYPARMVGGKSPEKARGFKKHRYPIETLTERGFFLATAYYGEIFPDRKKESKGLEKSIVRWYRDQEDFGFPKEDRRGRRKVMGKGKARRRPDEWGAVGAWAFGLSRIMDYLEQDPDVDGSRVAVFGHSRLGKAALWAGARDTRFSIVISNNSGCTGAALSRRRFGETVKAINDHFPHWFCENYKKYNDNEGALPVDQHMLVALVAPRPVYIASAQEDLWADPKGEFLSAWHASPVYELLGAKGLPRELSGELPNVNEPVMTTIGYHLRQGKHDLTAFDWEQYMRFARLHWGL